MPDNIEQPKIVNFKQEDIARVSLDVSRRKEIPENKHYEDSELVKHSIKEMVPAPIPSAPSTSGQIPDYATDAPSGSKLEIEHYINMAMSEGIDKAVSEASKSAPFIIDALHDALAGKMHEELKARNLI